MNLLEFESRSEKAVKEFLQLCEKLPKVDDMKVFKHKVTVKLCDKLDHQDAKTIEDAIDIISFQLTERPFYIDLKYFIGDWREIVKEDNKWFNKMNFYQIHK